MTAMPRTAMGVVVLVFGLLAVGCSSGASSPASSSSDSPFSLQVASSDLYVNAPQRFQIGVFRSTGQGVELLTGGSIPLTLVPGDGSEPINGQAHYVSAPGLPSSSTPSLTTPSQARGVYEMDVTFPSLGVWTAQLSFTGGGQPIDLTTSFGVSDKPALPAPGDRAFATKNLTMADAKTEPQAVDSRAQDGAKVPDPELHEHTIAQGLAEHRPILALFATPVYCQSQFCGPSTDALEQIAKTGPTDALYIHVEIYKDFGKQQINQAAAQWLLRNNDLTEPWLFLIGRDGRILDRWGPLFDPTQVSRELEKADR
jgi:hypothetical protein